MTSRIFQKDLKLMKKTDLEYISNELGIPYSKNISKKRLIKLLLEPLTSEYSYKASSKLPNNDDETKLPNNDDETKEGDPINNPQSKITEIILETHLIKKAIEKLQPKSSVDIKTYIINFKKNINKINNKYFSQKRKITNIGKLILNFFFYYTI